MIYIIRKGKQSDVSETLDLVRELAVFEKAPKEVEVTINEMKKWGFGPEKIFDFYVAEKNKRIIGIALYYFKYSTWKGKCIFLEDIIVTENERRKGVGGLLFKQILKIAKKQKVRRLEWQVLNWNKYAIKFYKKYNSNFDEEWINCKLTFQQLQSL